MGSRIIRAALAAAAAAGIAVAAAPVASAAPAGHHPRPDFSCSSCSIIEGTNYAVGAPDDSAGQPVTQETTGRTMTWVQQTTYLGYAAGFWKFSNGNYMAMNAGCNGATVKSSNTSSGVVWFMVDAGSGKWYVGNRYCDNQQHGNIVLEGDGVLHHQYAVAAIGACCGIWEKMTIA